MFVERVCGRAVRSRRGCVRCVWRRRYSAGLRGRPSRPHRSPRRLTAEAEAEIAALRRAAGAGPVALGAVLGRPASTVGKALLRFGLSRPERERAGQLLHVDIKRPGRFRRPGKALPAAERRTPSSIAHPRTAPRRSPSGCAGTTAADRTPRSAAFLPRSAPP